MLRSIQELGYSYDYFHIDTKYRNYTFYTSDHYIQVKQWISHWELIGIQIDSQTSSISILLTNIDEEQLAWKEITLPENTLSFFSFTPDGMVEILDFLATILPIPFSSGNTFSKYFTLLDDEEEHRYKLQRKSGPDQKLYRYFPPASDAEIIYVISFPYWSPLYGRNQRASLSFLQFYPQQLDNVGFRPRRDGGKAPFPFSQDSLREFLMLFRQFLYHN